MKAFLIDYFIQEKVHTTKLSFLRYITIFQTWDEELETMAQVWAEQCITNCMVNSCHDCGKCRKSKRFFTGQNYYNFGHFSGSWEKSVQGWYDEVADFNRSFVSPFQ